MPSSRTITGLLAALILLAFSSILGCAHAERGRPFDTAAASQIQVGKTTEAEVLASLGQPLSRKITADGTKIYGYSYAQAQAYAFSRHSKRVQGQGDKVIVSFDKNGIVSALEQGSMPVNAGSGLLKTPTPAASAEKQE